MEIRVTRPFIVSFIPGDQYGGPDCFISCLYVLFTEINQIKSNTSSFFRGPSSVTLNRQQQCCMFHVATNDGP